MNIALGGVYLIRSAADGGYINLAGMHMTSLVENGNLVNMYPAAKGKDQQWRLEAAGDGFYLCSGRNYDYCLNMRTTNMQCHAWNKNVCNSKDSLLDIAMDKSGGCYRIYLKARGLYLTKEYNALFWRREKGDNSQLFYFEEFGSKEQKMLDMPLNFSQKYEKNNIWVKKYGCAMCCGLDVSAYYGERGDNNIEHFYKNYRNSLGYTWGAPSAAFTRVAQGDFYGEIRSEIDMGRPVVVRISKENSNSSQHHFVVARGYAANCAAADDVFVLDPAGRGGEFSGGYKTLKQAMVWNGGKYHLTRLELTKAKGL